MRYLSVLVPVIPNQSQNGFADFWRAAAATCKSKSSQVSEPPRALLDQADTVINGLVSPCGKVGYVNIATGPLSSQTEEAIVPIGAAIALLKDMGGSSVKYFPMRALLIKEEYEAVAKACAENDFYLEPTGGIDLEEFSKRSLKSL